MRPFRKARIVCCLIACFYLCWPVLGDEQLPTTSTQPNLHVDVFGTKTGKLPITKGYVFLDGRYLDTPYQVDRRGDALFINGRLVRHYKVKWPPYKLRENTDPGVPKGLTRMSRFPDDGTPAAHWRRKLRYLAQHKSPGDVPQAMRKYFLSLPNVKSAEFKNPQRKCFINVELWNGQTTSFEVIPHQDLANPKNATAQDVLQWLDHHRAELEEQLRKGDCLFIFTGPMAATFRIASGAVPQALPAVLGALCSDASDASKLQTLELWNVISPGPTDHKRCKPLLESFRTSDQLAARIQSLLDEHPRRPRPISFKEYDAIMKKVLKMDLPMKEKRRMLGKLLAQKQAEIEAEFEAAQQGSE